MARSRLTEPTDDLITDSGAVLWSFVKGEQLEFPVTLSFLLDATQGYTYEAVIVEALNTANQIVPPVTIQPNGVQTVLGIRVPVNAGIWSSTTLYQREDVVLYSGVYYRLLNGTNYSSSTTPNNDSYWSETTLNKIYIQFPSSIAATWTLAPTASTPVYGFFELRVTEPVTAVYRRTWKPVRGLVEINFSPTDIVAD